MWPNGLMSCYNGQGLNLAGVDPERLLLAFNGDPGCLRPFWDRDGKSKISLNQRGRDGNFAQNNYTITTPSTLTKEEWLEIDGIVLKVTRAELIVAGTLVQMGLTYNIPNALAKTVIQHSTMTDAGEAIWSMDALQESNRDRVQFDLVNLPIPIVSADGQFSMREILASRNSQNPLDLVMFEQNTRRCSEQIEKVTIGTVNGMTYGGGTIYGLTNHPSRNTSTITSPSVAANAWTPQILFQEILAMIQTLQNKFFRGPYGIFVSPGWSQYIDDDYSQAYNGSSLRTRLLQVEGVQFVKRADYLNDLQIVVFQMTPDVVQMVTGLPITTMQWESHGGMKNNFKTMGIMFPRVRVNANGDSGINHATAA